ncbi:aminopeptidase [Coemansia javaensis]|uniref:Aminopeptidase n=1 Tax=Coemansia javaensis TaxID=2761396 RepID=A0A9W8HAI4_9FUNG|nr:aminopeptidase [Coemansia javaensis]
MRRVSLNGAHRRDRGLLSTLLQTARTRDPITSEWLGQPTHALHPELVGEGELTPGIAKAEYDERRRRIARALPDGAVALLFSASTQFVSPHVFHEFRQDSDFYYLTGWNEPDSVVAIEKNGYADRGYTMTMFVRPKDPAREVWEGPRSGLEAAVDVFGADEARPIREFGEHAARLAAAGSTAVYADLDDDHGLVRSRHCQTLRQQLQRHAGAGARLFPLGHLVQQERLVKSAAEIRLMREASRVTAAAFAATMRACRPGVCESTLQATFAYASKMALAGARPDRSVLTRPAYVPVFAAGEHAMCMHYVLNQGPVPDGCLVLADAGAEYAAYASDVTRTFPASGRFTEPQRDLYSAVLSVQEQMVRLCYADSGYSLNEIHRCSVRALVGELKQIGLRVAERDVERHLCPHHISHYLGMDVHDTVDMPRSQRLRANMVVTVEPGVYVPYNDRFPKAFQGIGIRIEDNIVVGQAEADIENLSRDTPKSVADIEACMAR